MVKVLILGCTGQDGSYLTEILLKEGYEVHGLVRKSATSNTINIDHIISSEYYKSGQFKIVRGDLLDHASIFKAISQIEPDFVYNEADQDHVSWSYDIPSYSLSTTTTAAVNILESIKIINPKINFFQPVSSNMFGIPIDETQNEKTSHYPVSPYGIAKSATFHLCRFYRESYDMNVSTGILYNHESPRRPEEYLSRKVTMAVAKIKKGIQKKLVLGDLNGYVDWGYAKEFMEIAKKINESNLADDFVVGTGVLTKVEDFVKIAFDKADLNWKDYVTTSEQFKRPVPTGTLCADTSKLEEKLSIKPKVLIDDLISIMLENDLKNVR
jgi:GDPmannose 4,6-dehydratase